METRSWYTKYRGPLFIHASKTYPRWARDCEKEEPFYSALRPNGIYKPPDFWLGYIIGKCSVVDCVSTERVTNLSRDEEEFGDYSANRFAWLLDDGQFLPLPVMAKGSLGLWEPPACLR
jgi:activating signal cointegrator 1